MPPVLLTVTPESGAVNVTDESAVFTFDVIVDDRAGRAGNLASSFLVSPNEGGTVVSWHRDRVEVRPRRGFREGVAYSVTMLPGVADLNRNVLRETRVISFSIGPTIPPYAIHGRVFDWMAERIAGDARIDVIRMPDSLPYVGVTDSAGQFAIGPLDEGTYTVRALLDNNRNGLRDPNEMWDTTRIVVKGETPFVELRAALRDTLGPRLLTVAPIDSVTFLASFDHVLDAATPLTRSAFRVQRADSTELLIARVYTQSEFQRVRAAREAAPRDSVAGRREPPTTGAPKPSLPAPARDAVIELDATTPLLPLASYRVTAIEVRSLTGVARTSERAITIPKRDTTRAPGRRP